MASQKILLSLLQEIFHLFALLTLLKKVFQIVLFMNYKNFSILMGF